MAANEKTEGILAMSQAEFETALRTHGQETAQGHCRHGGYYL